MLRRDFLKSTGAALAFSAMPAYAAQFENTKKRVALIGTGWYGKSDLFRLLQVAPNTEVVSLCDADSNLLNECADMCADRQASKKRPRTFKNYQELLDQKDIDIALIATEPRVTLFILAYTYLLSAFFDMGLIRLRAHREAVPPAS